MTAPTSGFQSLRKRVGVGISDAQAIYLVLAVILVVSWAAVAAAGRDFLTVGNITNMLVRSVALGIVAMGQTLVILGASIDLSVAYLISVTAVLTSFLMDGDPSRIPLAVAAVLAVGFVVGLANGLLITKVGAHPFIATLGMALILRGLLSSRFSTFTGSVPTEFRRLGYARAGPVPYSVILLLIIFGLCWWLLSSTRFGAHLYAVGGSQEIARLSGVRSDRVIIGAHILCSLTAVLTGLFIASRIGAGAPWVGPDGLYDLESIAAVVLGGTALLGGRGGVQGTLAAVFILAALDSVFNQLQVDPYLKTVIRGVIIIAAVATFALRARNRQELEIA